MNLTLPPGSSAPLSLASADRPQSTQPRRHDEPGASLMVPCWTCGGEGRVPASDDPEEGKSYECARCEGDGRVPAECVDSPTHGHAVQLANGEPRCAVCMANLSEMDAEDGR